MAAISTMPEFVAIRANLLSLPPELLIVLPGYLHTIEDFTHLSSTCRILHTCLSATSPREILRLAKNQTKTFFRPAPHFLVAATARQLGDWARHSPENEAEFASRVRDGIWGLLKLALEHCGLTMARIRELHLMRFSTINPVTDIVDKCVGIQWCSLPDFWDGGVSDCATINADASETLFHLIIYGELFGPDLEAYLNQDTTHQVLSLETRLEVVKYCIPDLACLDYGSDEHIDPRRRIERLGPYRPATPSCDPGRYPAFHFDNNNALAWLLQSSRWQPHWRAIRELGGAEFEVGFEDGYTEATENTWRQRLWENIMVCQGLEGLRMISPNLEGEEKDRWVARIKDWREKIDRLTGEGRPIMVDGVRTCQWPYLHGDLRVVCRNYA